VPNMQSKFFYIFTFLFIFFVVSWILFYLCSRCVIVDIGGCNLKFFSLGDSMALDHKVCTFVVNCICRKFFLDERPTISLKHYFFSCVSVSILILLFFWKLNNWSILFIIFLCHQVVFMSDSDDYSYIERCFNGATSVLPLPLCELVICISLNNVPIAHPWIFMPIFFCLQLFFPVLYCEHWFLFVVDLKQKMFLFLDSYFSKDDDYSVLTRRKLVSLWPCIWFEFRADVINLLLYLMLYDIVCLDTQVLSCMGYVCWF